MRFNWLKVVTVSDLPSALVIFYETKKKKNAKTQRAKQIKCKHMQTYNAYKQITAKS